MRANKESKELESRLVVVLTVENQEVTAINIFTNRKNNSNAFPHTQICFPMCNNNKMHTHKHIS